MTQIKLRVKTPSLESFFGSVLIIKGGLVASKISSFALLNISGTLNEIPQNFI